MPTRAMTPPMTVNKTVAKPPQARTHSGSPTRGPRPGPEPPSSPPSGSEPSANLRHFLLPATAQRELAADTQPSGMTTKVSNVDTSTPDASEMAMPWKIGSKKITEDPATNASAVIKIGRVRVLHAEITASTTASPCWIR